MPSALCSSVVLLLVASTAASDKPNFIFFQPDEMRAESVGCYGHPVVKTPNFDKFAAEGTRFDQAHVSYTVCSQSRVAFMTAWPTHVRGHRTLWSLLHKWEPNLFKYFKSDGYDVKWWGKNDMLAPDAWNVSVTTAMGMGGINTGKNPYKPGDPEFFSFLNNAAPGNASATADGRDVVAAIDFLRKYKKGEDPPFFIFLPLLKPHPPYSCPEPFYSSVDPTKLPPLRPIGTANKPDYHGLIRSYRNITTLDDTFFRKLHAVYLGSIEFSDFLFGMLLAAVDEAKLADSTTISVFADHGDYAGDYGLVEKWPR
jgi:choline-sulfatase